MNLSGDFGGGGNQDHTEAAAEDDSKGEHNPSEQRRRADKNVDSDKINDGVEISRGTFFTLHKAEQEDLRTDIIKDYWVDQELGADQ